MSGPLWEYQIGGYQVLHKWLKDRKDRALTLNEVQTYCRIVTALAKTIEVQKEIDALYPSVEETLLEIELDEQGRTEHRACRVETAWTSDPGGDGLP